MDIIISHVNLDFDSLAAMVAARKLYPEAQLVLPGSMGKNVREFVQLHRDLLDYCEPNEIVKSKVKRAIIVDTRLAGRLGELKNVVKKKAVEVFTFDHHPTSPSDLKSDQDFSEKTGATITILVKILRARQIGISPFEASLFALGIHEDTGSLTYASTTYDDAEALAYLVMKRANTDVIHRYLELTLDSEQQELLGKLLKSAHTVDVNGVLVMFTRAKVKTYVDSASALTHKVGDLENIDVVVTLLELKDRVNIIGRSCISEVDMADVLAAFGGGGHPQAASAVVKIRDLKKIEDKIIAEIAEKREDVQKVSDIMTKLVHTVDLASSVKEARDQMRRFGVTGMLITKDSKLVGIITRKEVEAAAAHGLMHAPVKGFINKKVITIQPDSPVAEVQDILSRTSIDQVPVIDDDGIIGIVSRREILRKMHGPSYKLPTRAPFEPSKQFGPVQVKARLDALLPHKSRTLLTTLGEIGDKLDLNVYMVGGFVRDLIMNHKNLDIDIVVEGSGEEFAKEAAKTLIGRLTYHEKFATAVIILPDGFRVDVATARTEFYEHPAALPQVELGSIRQDLFRRDFTINAMAISIRTKSFGELLDYFGGEDDIADRKIEVLHELSFIDDPTRIFRAVRFEQRYGFQMSNDTEKLIVSAVKMELIGRLTGVRIRDEIVALLNEPAPWQPLKRLEELGVLISLNDKLKVDKPIETRLREVSKALAHFRTLIRHPFRRWLVFLMGFVERIPSQELDVFFRTLKLRKEDCEIALSGLEKTPGILKALVKHDLTNSAIYVILRELPEETVFYVYARAPKLASNYIERYFNIRGTRIDVTGNDLIEMGQKPSLEFSKVLDRLLMAKIDGHVYSREEQLDLARQLFLDKNKRGKR